MVVKITEFRVKRDTDVKKLCNAIVSAIKNKETLQIVVVGMPALYTAMKGVALARGMLLGSGIELAVSPYFKAVNLPSGEERTALVLMCIAAPIFIEVEQNAV